MTLWKRVRLRTALKGELHMSIKECITMILAGGRGERLGSLTRYYSKPSIHFGGKSRIIDFTMRNCKNSGIDTVGILSQYCAEDMGEYIETAYGSYSADSNIHMLPPRNSEDYYVGTADAIYKNIWFMEKFNPKFVLVLAGDHIYNMDYRKMIGLHMDTGADVTVASTLVSMQEASRFGIINADENGRISGFEEKPKYPKSRLASMGIYVFNWDKLIKYLLEDNANTQSKHDFGRNIIPAMLRAGESMYTYQFDGYWRDVGTVDSLWAANMDQLDRLSDPLMQGGRRGIIGPETGENFYSSQGSSIHQSIISEDCSIFGKIDHSVLGDRVTVGTGAQIVDSVIMPGAYIGNNAEIYKTVVGTNAVIMDDTVIGDEYGPDFFSDGKICANGVSLVAPWLYIEEGAKFKAGSNICGERLREFAAQIRRASHKNVAVGFYNPKAEAMRPEYAIRHA